jgi:predicted extracellular nuclease
MEKSVMVLRIFSLFLLFSVALNGQTDSSLQVVFYNVENLFDTIDQPGVSDSEYTPGSDKNWNQDKLDFKVKNIAKTVVGAAGWGRPDIVGLCELENRAVLQMIADNPAFDGLDMQVVHYDSPDRRGIDVGLLYSDLFLDLVHSEAIRIHFEFDTTLRTRDILYVKFDMTGPGLEGSISDRTIHVYVCHWPSRYGGKEASEPKRITAGAHLRGHIDSILQAEPEAQILIMGDMNDHPADQSITNALGARTDTSDIAMSDLYALMALELNFPGSHRYYGEWSFLDQFIVSANLLTQPNPQMQKISVYTADYLLEEDKRFPGEMPFRTYSGPYYKGGYSDHLPIFLEIQLR